MKEKAVEKVTGMNQVKDDISTFKVLKVLDLIFTGEEL